MTRHLLFSLLLVVAGTFVLAGCNGDEPMTTEPRTTAPPPPAPAPRPAPAPAPAPSPEPAPVPSAPGMASTTMILPSGEAQGGVIRLVRSAPENVLVGAEFDYTITLTNLLRKPLAGVALSEKLGTNFKLTGANPKANMSGNTLVWNVGSMKAGESQTFTIRGSAQGTGPVIGCAEVAYGNPEVCLAIKAVQPALQIAKTGPAEVILCDPITYRIVVSNPGSGSAANIVVTDNLPDGITTLDGKQALAMSVGSLAPGESRELTIQAKAARKGTFANSASAKADGGLTAQSGQVTTKVTKPELAVTKTGPAMRYVGGTATYTVKVANTGDAPAKNTVLTDTLPANATLVGTSVQGMMAGQKITWDLGTLDAGASKTVDVTLKMTEMGTVRNVAAAEAYCAKGAAEAITQVKGIPAILLECVDLADPIEIGAQEIYEITVTNQGSAVGTNIVITCTLPAEQEFVSATGPTKETVAAKTVTFAPLASLAAKAKVIYKVVTKGIAAADSRFKVSLKSDQMDSPAEETESTHIYSDK
ncbi:MAG TPA: hypothetical protein VM695_09890 [Phycisphaerae bacterium]|nr:hypothetical protein [Phycisphaerae bacterium]